MAEIKKRWIGTAEFEKVFGIKKSTQAVKRKNGTLPYTKYGGKIFYDREEIDRVLEDNKVSKKESERNKK